jgi:hypothetical protein
MSSRSTISWMQTWSAPAWRRWRTRSAMACSSPHATSASIRRSLPGAVTSAFVEPATAPVVDVVGQPEVVRHPLAGDVAGPRGVGFEDHTLLRGQQRTGPQDLAGSGGVLGSHQIGVRTAGPAPGQLEHPGPEGGQHPIATSKASRMLVLLYSQQTSRLVALKVSDVTMDTNGAVTLKLGATPVVLPQPVDRSVAELIEQRRGYAAVSAGDNPWLFPGGRSGQHLSPERMGARLRAIGIIPRLAPNTALIELAGELPAAVIAKLLGYSVKHAVAWNIEAGNTHPRYSAAVARRSPG